MEILTDKFFRPLLSLNNGHGCGDGYGSGYGCGDGGGNGDGYSNGSGDGNGSGYGNGNSNGSGDRYKNIKSLNGLNIYSIDNIPTSITTIKNDIAKGHILNKDLTFLPCYIVRNDYYYAHGKNLKEALKSLEEKTLENLPISKRIEKFKEKFKNFNTKYKVMLLSDWHHKLTGSCKMGRDSFIKNNNILLTCKYSVNEFIELTQNEYGGDIIKQLR